MALATQITAKLHSDVTGVGDFGNPSAVVDVSFSRTIANGVASGQANVLFAGKRTLAASATENLDLSGVLKDVLGQNANFAKVKALMIKAADANVNDVVIGAAASNPFLGPLGGTTPTITLKPGAFVILAHPLAGWTCADGANDQLKVLNSAGGSSVTYDVAILGTSS